VYTKTTLKLQNVTSDNGIDIEADDITRVPLTGKCYTVRGNNFCKKDNGPQLVGHFNPQNEEAIFGAWTHQVQNSIGGTSVGHYAGSAGPINNNQTTFLKPAEPPRQYEIQNCTGMSNLSIAPGEIKYNTMVAKYTFSFPYYFAMLYSNNTVKDRIVYNQRLGKSFVFYCEKVVGRPNLASNNIVLWTELEFRQSVLAHGSAQNFTAPITFQTDWT